MDAHLEIWGLFFICPSTLILTVQNFSYLTLLELQTSHKGSKYLSYAVPRYVFNMIHKILKYRVTNFSCEKSLLHLKICKISGLLHCAHVDCMGMTLRTISSSVYWSFLVQWYYCHSEFNWKRDFSLNSPNFSPEKVQKNNQKI